MGYDFERTCDECGCDMNYGFCIHDGEEYYCSRTCLNKHYTDEEYNEMYDEDEAYWTDWEDDLDATREEAI